MTKELHYLHKSSSSDREVKESHQWYELPRVDGVDRLQTAGCGKSPATTTTSLWCKKNQNIL